MLSVALLSLLLPVASPATVAAPSFANATRTTAADPSVQVSLDRSDYEPGDQARMTVRVRDDGYLLVLRLSPDGYVRVLFPLDPGDDNFVRGDGSYEIRGRGDRNAFTISSVSGTGTVYAAWSTEPFRFDDYVLGDHWDYKTLDGSLIQGDPEAGLTDLAQRMSTSHFDYDLVSYSVARDVAYTSTTHYTDVYPAPVGCFDYDYWCGGYGSGLNISIGFGWGRFHRGFYDPYFYDPYYYPPYYRYGGYYPRYYHCFACGYRYPRVVVINPPGFRGRYPYEWKPGSRGGGGALGVPYRPRSAFASANGQAVSPLFVASKYRRVANDASRKPASGRRQTTVFGSPVTSGVGAGVGTPRRDRGEPEVVRGGVSRGPTAPRRAGESGAVSGGRRATGTGVTPRIVDGVGAGASSASGGARVAEPRRAEPRGAMPTGSRATPSSEPRQAEPRRVEPRTVEAGSAAPRSAAPQRVEPRALRAEPRAETPEVRSAPQRVEPTVVRSQPRAAARRVEQRAQPQRVEQSAPVQRSQPRASAPRMWQPRSAPARASQPRSAPASRGRRP